MASKKRERKKSAAKKKKAATVQRTAAASVKLEKQRLAQETMLGRLCLDIAPTEMVTVHLSDHDGPHSHGIYCALVPSTKIEKALSSTFWDLKRGHGYPGAAVYYADLGETTTRYLRFGNETGIEPLVIDRYFHGLQPDYKEISEEFRLFHRLYHDRNENRYIKIDDDGNEYLVATIEPDRVQIRLKEIRQFLAVKEMHLSIQFDCREHSEYSLQELGLRETGTNHRVDLCSWAHCYGNSMPEHGAFSRLVGKRLIAPLPKEKSGLWGFAEEQPKQHVEFIIGLDENGDEIKHTSDPDALGNRFGSSPGTPDYLTQVQFRKTVLDKYYQQPTKYVVGDATLRCGHLWSMHMDNHHTDKVCAWLGDLGRDLSYEEQLHWRAHNVPPDGEMSETFLRRQLEAQFADSDRPEHVFKRSYDHLAKVCEECLGWRLLLPLDSDEAHHYRCIRIPSTDEQRDFDDLVLSLTKILIDSLNEKELNGMISSEQRRELKGSIARLEATFVAKGVTGAVDHIAFLRKLQHLRSTGSAHRKGSNYRKIASKFGVDSQSLRAVFTGILGQALGLLDFLTAVVQSKNLSGTDTVVEEGTE